MFTAQGKYEHVKAKLIVYVSVVPVVDKEEKEEDELLTEGIVEVVPTNIPAT